MPWLNFEMFLPDGFSIIVDDVRHRGRVTSFVVRLMVEPASEAFAACSLQCSVCD
jgi:hypothetical protein